MRHITQFLKPTCTVILCGILMATCRKPETEPGNPPANNQTDSTNADIISDHLQFFDATKKQGTIPKGPAGSILKISFKDTLYLMDQVKGPIKFLHEDTTQNIAGIYVQVHGTVIGGTGATYYYDVPELTEMEESDSVSVIMIGFDPAGFEPPLTFDITITPYDESGHPIAEVVRPVKIAEHNVEPNGNAGSCGLVLPDDESWHWELSYILAEPITEEHPFYFYNDPNKIFGAGGQVIKGNCCNGISVYGPCVPGDTTLNASLHFATSYRIMSETLEFHDGTFLRQTFEDGANPLPASSDFCAGGEGMISYNLNHTIYNGNYTVTATTLPPDLQGYDDSLRLTLQTTSSSPQGSGFGNSGGIIHQLDCTIGALVLIQLDLEGGGNHLYKFYRRRNISDPYWYAI